MWKRGGQEESISEIQEPKFSLQLWVPEIGERKKTALSKTGSEPQQGREKEGLHPIQQGQGTDYTERKDPLCGRSAVSRNLLRGDK